MTMKNSKSFYYKFNPDRFQNDPEIYGPFRSIESAVKSAQKKLDREMEEEWTTVDSTESVEITVGHRSQTSPPSKSDMQEFMAAGVQESTTEGLLWTLQHDCHLNSDTDEISYKNERAAEQAMKAFLSTFLPEHVVITRYAIDPLGSTVHVLKPTPPKPSKAMAPHIATVQVLEASIGADASPRTKQALQQLLSALRSDGGSKKG